MPGNYSRINVEADGNILTASNYNAEHDNHITNHTPTGLDDYSVSVAQSNIQTDPGATSSESLPSSLAGELERIRYVISRIVGQSLWRDVPATSLQTLGTPSGGLHIGLEFEGKDMGAASTTDVLAKVINQGGIINALSLSSADITTAAFDSTNKKFGNYSLALNGSRVLGFPAYNGNSVKGSLSCWFRNLASGDYIAYNPLLGLELYVESVAGKLTAKVTERTPASESTKESSMVQGSATRSGDTTFRNAIMRWRTNQEGGAATDLLELLYAGANEGTQLSAQTFNVNQGDGGIWFLGAKRNDPTWIKYSAMSVLPSAEASDAWTGNGTTAGNAVSDGVLTIDSTGAAAGATDFYSKTNNINLATMTVAWKMKVNTVAQRSASSDDQVEVGIDDTSMSRSIRVFYSAKSVSVDFEATNERFQFFLDTTKYHTYQITSSGSPSPTVNFYIDGVLVLSATNSSSSVTGADLIFFGDNSTASGKNSSSSWEYFAYVGTVAQAPMAASSQGNIDSFGVCSSNISATLVSSLQNNKITDVFNKEPNYGPTLPINMIGDRNNIAISTTSTTFENFGTRTVYYIAGDGVTEYLFQFGASISNTSTDTTFLAVDIDDDITGLTQNSATPEQGPARNNIGTANAEVFTIALRNAVLTPGLHEIRPSWAVSASTGNADDEGSQFFMRQIVQRAIL